MELELIGGVETLGVGIGNLTELSVTASAVCSFSH